ncbi:unnamed protein product [Caretta caretta]
MGGTLSVEEGEHYFCSIGKVEGIRGSELTDKEPIKAWGVYHGPVVEEDIGPIMTFAYKNGSNCALIWNEELGDRSNMATAQYSAQINLLNKDSEPLGKVVKFKQNCVWDLQDHKV